MNAPQNRMDVCTAQGDTLGTFLLGEVPVMPRIGDDIRVGHSVRRVTRVVWVSVSGNIAEVWTEPYAPKEACPNCESTLLSWSPVMLASAPIATNRLGLADVHADFVLGCEECSETIRSVSAEAVAKAISEQDVVVREVE